jgi:hypothetical protein
VRASVWTSTTASVEPWRHGCAARPRRLTANAVRRAGWRASGLRASKRIIMTAGGDWERNGARRRRPWIFFAATSSASGRANQRAGGPEGVTCSKRLQAPPVFRVSCLDGRTAEPQNRRATRALPSSHGATRLASTSTRAQRPAPAIHSARALLHLAHMAGVSRP